MHFHLFVLTKTKMSKNTDTNVTQHQCQSCSAKLAESASSETFKNQNIQHDTKRRREKVDKSKLQNSKSKDVNGRSFLSLGLGWEGRISTWGMRDVAPF